MFSNENIYNKQKEIDYLKSEISRLLNILNEND